MRKQQKVVGRDPMVPDRRQRLLLQRWDLWY